MSHPTARVVASATRKVLERFTSQGVPPPTARRLGSIVRATTSEVKKVSIFDDIRVRSAFTAHPPNPDPFEMRKSATFELTNASLGFKRVHILEDGTVKSPSQIASDSNAFKEREERLTAQENWYPHLKQTEVREKARRDMFRELKYLKAAETISLEDKVLGKYNAILRYEKVLEQQKEAREMAKAELYSGVRG